MERKWTPRDARAGSDRIRAQLAVLLPILPAVALAGSYYGVRWLSLFLWVAILSASSALGREYAVRIRDL
jgi:hypothetical protein